MQNPVRVIEIQDGEKIAWEQDDYKLIFGDDELTVRCDKRQRDWPVHADVSFDADDNLIVGVGRYYIAQIDIPARQYVDIEGEANGNSEAAVRREAVPLDMADVTLTLWYIGSIN